MFYDNFLACFHHGAQYNQDFRILRFLRLVASAISHSGKNFTEDNSQVKYIPSVTSFLIFESWKQFVVNPEIEGIFQALAKAYILDKVDRHDDPTLTLMSHGKGHIVQATAEKVLGQEKLSLLKSQGHVGIVRGPHGKVLVLPKIPEFLAVAAAFIIADDCLSIYREKGFENAYSMLVEESDHFPHGDLVGARALLEISKRERKLAHDFIFKLLADEPEQSRLAEGSRVLMYFEDVGEINVHFGKGTDKRVTGNIHPWQILSQLSSFAALAYEGSLDPLLTVFATIGSYPQIMIRPYSGPFKQTTGYHVHEIPGHGSVLCHKTGIIETITYAMQRGFYHIPKDMLRLCLFAKEKNLFFLAHRLNMAAISTETCIEKDIARASKEAQTILRPIIRNVTETAHAIGQKLGQGHGKVGRNAPCPCGSGKKYKKCCGR